MVLTTKKTELNVLNKQVKQSYLILQKGQINPYPVGVQSLKETFYVKSLRPPSFKDGSHASNASGFRFRAHRIACFVLSQSVTHGIQCVKIRNPNNKMMRSLP
jgi:hypothetical protein